MTAPPIATRQLRGQAEGAMTAAEPADPSKPFGGFGGTAYYASAEPVLGAEDLVTTDGNRWSQVGEPTVYLAGDPSLALAEFARHAPSKGAPEGVIWTVTVRLVAAVDLRDRARADGLGDGQGRWLDRGWCRSIAARLRASGACDGLVVPSAAMLDRPERWNLVVFVDRLRRPLPDALVIHGPLAAVRPTRLEATAVPG